MTRWKVSAKWAARAHDCTLSGIRSNCAAGCCTSGPSGTYWPARAWGNAPRQRCGMLGENGCTFAREDRPVGCLLYPLVVNPTGTLILHHRVVSRTSCCKAAHGSGPPIIEAVGWCLTLLFGADQYARVRDDVLAGRDSWLDVPEAIETAVEQERQWQAQNLPPEPRSIR